MDKLLPPDGTGTDQVLRGWLLDSALLAEPSDSFTKGHNCFTRAGPFAESRRQVISDKLVFLCLGQMLARFSRSLRKRRRTAMA